MALNRDTIAEDLRTGREARLQALVDYLQALPVETHSEWEFLVCVLHDVAALHVQIRKDIQQT